MDFLLLVWLRALGKGIVCLCFLVGIIWFKIWKMLLMRFNAYWKDAGTTCQEKKKKAALNCGWRKLQEQTVTLNAAGDSTLLAYNKDMDKHLSGRVKLTQTYWLQILSSSPV